MSLPVPRLDDKGWAELVEEARARIPRVTREWTDFNVHDPGITFLELFAWLAEIQRFRLDQLPDATVRRFLGLLGLQPLSLRPARTWVRFAAPPGAAGPVLPRPWVLVRAGTPVVRAGPESLGYQAVRDTFLTDNEIVGVRTEAGGRRLEHLETNASPDVPFFAFGETAPVGAALEVELKRAPAEPVLDLGVELFEDGLPAPGEQLDEEEARPHPSAELVWEYRGDEADWAPVEVEEDQTRGFHRSGLIRFRPPAGPAPGGSFTLRCRVAGGRYEVPPRVRALSLNVVEVVQIETEVNEPLGEGDGRPDQGFRLGARQPRPGPPLQRWHLVERPESRTRVQAGDLLASGDALPRALAWADPGLAAGLLRSLPPELTEAAPGDGALRVRPLASQGDAGERDRALFDLARALDGLLSDPAWLAEPGSPAPDAADPCDPAAGGDDARARGRELLARRFPALVAPAGLLIEVGRPRAEDLPAPAWAEGGVEWQPWDRVDGFSRSAFGDRHYLLEEETPDVRFGTGLNGRVPRRGDLVRARVYHHSRGAAGNAPPRQQWNLGIPGVRLTGTNPLAATDGRDPETADEMRLRAEQRFHERIRAVTADDLERIARATPGLRVHRARALPGHHPRLCGIRVPGSVTVVVVPFQRPGDPRPPVPGEGFLRTVAEHLDRHRLLTTTIHVVGPQVVRFALSARVFLASRSSPAEVLRRLREVLTRFFDPLRGGPEAGGWPLGRPVYPSEIYERLDQDPGVDYATRVRLTRLPVEAEDAGGARGTPPEPDQPLALPPTGLPLLSWSDSALELVSSGRQAPGEDPERGGGSR